MYMGMCLCEFFRNISNLMSNSCFLMAISVFLNSSFKPRGGSDCGDRLGAGDGGDRLNAGDCRFAGCDANRLGGDRFGGDRFGGDRFGGDRFGGDREGVRTRRGE